MTDPPRSAQEACLAVLERASVLARFMGDSGRNDGLSSSDAAHLSDLMDTVHNLPFLLLNWDRCDEDMLRSMLRQFDQKWMPGQFGLLGLYDQKRRAV